MAPHQLSSGDLIADRRAEYAQMLAEGGDPAAAADLMRQALELAPSWAAGWFRLAEHAESAGNRQEAAEALARVLALDPDDMFGAGLKRAVLGADAVPEQAPSAYVARLFDDYADRFDTALVERLAYTVPHRLATMVRAATDGARLRDAVDLGCGTGLFGAEIRASADRLEGYDLSANMLAKAAEKRLYDHLAQADLSLPPAQSGVLPPALPAGRADLVAAADVLMYLGDLVSVFAIVRQILSPGGLFAFSIEDAGPDASVLLRPSLRYAHSERYIRALCEGSGLDMVELDRAIIRKDGAEDIAGILFVTRSRL